jgi:hypothetical protein
VAVSNLEYVARYACEQLREGLPSPAEAWIAVLDSPPGCDELLDRASAAVELLGAALAALDRARAVRR